MRSESIVGALLEIRDLLQRYEYFAQATLIEEMITHSDSDRARFLELVGGAGMWGSSGSVFDLNITSEGSQESRLDQRRLRQLLLSVAEDLVEQGDPTGHARPMVDILRAWQDIGRSS